MEFNLSNNFLIFDGAMGTMLLEEGLMPGELPEIYNITHPEIIYNIHKQYILSGSEVITTNTFGANELKYKDCQYTYSQVIEEGVKIAKRAAEGRLVALDIGPIGQLLKPMGTLSFEDAYNIFKNQMIIGEKCGADLILIETISDIYEAKAAILAAKENTKLPVICTLTFQSNGRTLTGTDPLTAVTVLEGLGLDALGVNCSLGPRELIPIIEEMLMYSHIPIIVQPNRGLPKIVNGETTYELQPEEFADDIKIMADMGVRAFGGCCGTTPQFIKAIKNVLIDLIPKIVSPINQTAVCSSSNTVVIGNRVKVIGERINPTGKKNIKEALINNDLNYILNEAINQKNAGADILDVNVGLPGINEKEMMKKAVEGIQGIIELPLQIDSAESSVIEESVRIYNGKPLVNSVNGTAESMKRIFPIVKKYSCSVIGLTLDEDGIPDTAEQRLEIARKIISTAEQYGIEKHNIIIDCLVVTASAQQQGVFETLKAVNMIKEELGVKTVLGISNVSFGLPQRELLNKTYLAMALMQGLDTVIINPLSKEVMDTVYTYNVLVNRDKDSIEYIKRFNMVETVKEEITGDKDLPQLIAEGLIEQVKSETRQLLLNNEPMQIIEEFLIPELNRIGDRYEKGEIFLPQLMLSSEAVKSSFEILKGKLNHKEDGGINKGKILLATVKGDIHDIGKNIVKILLQNYGFEVLDLGKDVAKEEILKAVKEHNIKLIGLSSLMTTTIKNMQETVEYIKQNCDKTVIMVGGAVLNEEYAKNIGADFYGKDGIESVKIAQRVLNG